MATISEDLLRILVCPISRKPVVQVGDWLYSTDAGTRRKYPIRDGLPIMLIDEAQVAEVAEFQDAMRQAGRAGTRTGFEELKNAGVPAGRETP